MLIVGAGPTGLTLAIRLQQLGVDCLVIDKEPAPLPWSRGLGLQARTLEIFDALGVLSAVRQQSIEVRAMHLHNQRGPLLELDLTGLDAPFPWVLSCPQTDVENCLIEHYLQIGGKLVRDTTLLDFRQNGHVVDARLMHAEESVALQCDLMVGCDGASSSVREQLGLSFQGVEHADQFLLADVDIDWPHCKESAHVFLSGEGALFALPLPRGWRLVLNVAAAETLSEEPSLAVFKQRLAHLFAEPPVLSEPHWVSAFSIHRRLVGRYRVNRVLLAGDACHVQSPVGAQGMNTGIADGFNLAWKLALFLQGIGGGKLLDSYETERRPVAKSMLTNVDFLSRSSFSRNVLWRGARDSMLKLVARQPTLSAKFLRAMSQLDVNYRDSEIVGAGSGIFASLTDEGPEPGDRMPDAHLKDYNSSNAIRLQSCLRDPKHHLFVQLSSELEHHEIVAAFALADRVPETFGQHVRTLLILANAMPDTMRDIEDFDVDVLVDEDGSFRAQYGESAGLWLMRPDGHLGYRAHLSDGDQLLSYLRAMFLQQG